MTSEKNNITVQNNNILAEKATNTGKYVFKHCYDEGGISEIYNYISKFNDLTVDVLNGIVHILLEKPASPNLEILLCVDDLLFIRGKKASRNQKGKRGGYKESQRKEIIEHLELLSKLRINISDFLVPIVDSNGKRLYQAYSGESPAIHLKRLDNKDYYFYIKPGEVLAMTLKGSGNKTGIIHKKISEYDYYRNFWEKRTGNYLAWLWRNRQNKANFLVPISIGTLLSQINIENNYKRPQSIRNKLENTLYKLENDGIIKSWQYKEIDESILTGKNWLKTWLNLKLIIEPPVGILEEYSKIKKIRTNNLNSRRKPVKKTDFSEAISIIKEQNISQIKIAEDTGINKEILSGILSGKIIPNLSEERKIQTWVNKQKAS